MADCQNCNKRRELDPVPFIAHESAMARSERAVKRLITALLIVIILWFSTIGIFVWYLNQYDFESYEYSQDGQGINIIGNRNGVDYDNVSDGEGS